MSLMTELGGGLTLERARELGMRRRCDYAIESLERGWYQTGPGARARRLHAKAGPKWTRIGERLSLREARNVRSRHESLGIQISWRFQRDGTYTVWARADRRLQNRSGYVWPGTWAEQPL